MNDTSQVRVTNQVPVRACSHEIIGTTLHSFGKSSAGRALVNRSINITTSFVKACMAKQAIELASKTRPNHLPHLRGCLIFVEREHPGSTYIAVEAPDELTLHLLQARLLDLSQNVYIRIGKAA